jgi:hypothetical protein
MSGGGKKRRRVLSAYEDEAVGGSSSNSNWMDEAADLMMENSDHEEMPNYFPMSNEELQAGMDAVNDEPEHVAEYYEPCPLPSRRKEFKRLGKPDHRSKCFLCAYIGERDTTLPSDDVNKIVEMLRKNTGRMDTVTLAEMIADYYAVFRQKINSSLRQGEKPLPPMCAATVVEHIRKHHQDPEVKQIVMLEELQELRETIMGVVMEKSNLKKHKRANKIQIDCLEKIIKLELVVQGKDPSKMALYAAGARLDPTIHTQGAVAGSTKRLFSYWGAVAGRE